MKQPLQKLDLKKCLGLDRAKREIEIEISSKILDDRVVSLRSRESWSFINRIFAPSKKKKMTLFFE